MPNRSWGDAFASAAKIQPEELGDDFLRKTEGDKKNKKGGIYRMSELVQSVISASKELQVDCSKHPSPSTTTTSISNTISALDDMKTSNEANMSTAITTDDTLLEYTKNRKKRKQKENSDTKNSNDNGNAETNFESLQLPLTKKQKQKREATSEEYSNPSKDKAGKQPASQNICVDQRDNTQNENSDNDVTNQVELEGRLFNNTMMVLVNKSNGKVFSGLERDENGDHVLIGSLDDNNNVILFEANSSNQIATTEKETKAENKSLTDKGLYPINAETEIGPIFPYPIDTDDHCETPLVAYEHLAPLLEQLLSSIGKRESSDLAIYDPYYCNGSVITKLDSLGYTNVYNKKEDCYKVWKKQESYSSVDNDGNTLPAFDAFVTNPPYSGDHIHQLMQYVTSSIPPRCYSSSSLSTTTTTPWFLLMPNWVHKKDYYLHAIQKRHIRPFYMIPKKRYVYEPPKEFREKKASDTHKKSSPFVSMWYIWGGSDETTQLLYNFCLNKGSYLWKECQVARSKSALRDLRRKK